MIGEQLDILRREEYSDTGLRCVEDALRYHADLYSTARSHRSGTAERLDAAVRLSAATIPGLEPADNLAGQFWLSDVECRTLEQAETIFVSADIVDEISDASATMLDHVLIKQDLFTPSGLLVLEKPFLYRHSPTVSGMTEGWMIKAIGYERSVVAGDDGITVCLYGNVDYVGNTEHNELCVIYKDRVVILSDSQNVEQFTEDDYDKSKVAFFSELSTGKGRFADFTRFNFGEQQTEYDPEVLGLKKFLLAYFRLSFEYLERESLMAGRPARRAAHHANLPSDGYVVQMKLRRALEGGHYGGTSSSPAYAFRVRGHWKRAYLPSRRRPVGDPAAYRHIYVKDYIKGRGDIVDSRRVLRVEK